MNKTYIILLILIGLILSIIIFPKFAYNLINLSINPRNSSICKAEERALKEHFQGIIYDKFRDTFNHNYETIRVEYLDSIYDSNILVLDNSDVFTYIQKGDSVSKESDNLVLYVSRNGLETAFRLSFDCEN